MWRTATVSVSRKIRTPSSQIDLTKRCLSSGPKPKKRFSKFLIGTAVVGIGGAAGLSYFYVQDPDEFQKQEENFKKQANDVYSTVMSYVSPTPAPQEEPKPLAKAPKVQPPEKPVVKDTPVKPTVPGPKATEKKEPSAPPVKPVIPVPPPEPVMSAAEKEKLEVEKRLQKQKEDEKAENAALEVKIENLMDSCVKKTREAVSLQQTVIDTTKKHSQLLHTAMDDSSDLLNKDSQWEAVSEAFHKRQAAIDAAKKAMNSVREDLEKLKTTVDGARNNKVTKSNAILIPAQKVYNTNSSELKSVESQVQKSENESKLIYKYNDLVEEGKKKFQKELESLIPDVKLGKSKGKKLTEEELNSLIAHAHRRIEQLQKQLASHMALEKERIQKVLEEQRNTDEKLADKRMKDEVEKVHNAVALEKQKWDMDARVKFEDELRHSLARQAAAHSDHLKEVLKVQEGELHREYEKNFNLKILEERKAFQAEIAGWVARLKGIETAVENRAGAEKVARQAQNLWLESLALTGSIKRGNEGSLTWEERLKPLGNDIVAIHDAAGSHPFVNVVISTIPEKAYVRGVWTEDALRDRFVKVSRVCKRVGAIDETGGSLYKYLLSYLQSCFIFYSSYDFQDSHKTVNLAEMNNFELLANANYWMEKGDFEIAVRYMNHLQGKAREVASDWLKEAKLLLETRQAAYALSGFALASGLANIL